MKKLILSLSRFIDSFIPDAFIFCLLLTLLVFVSAFFLTPYGAQDLVNFWGKDFWSLNSFSMQMIFVLVTGQMLASTKLISTLLNFFVERVRNPLHILVILSFISLVTCWVNWGLGLMVSAILAVELGKKNKKLNFPLVVATAYSGFVIWHGGLSGSIPLKIVASDEILSKWYPGLSIPLSESLFSSLNLGIVLSHLLIFPLIAFVLGKFFSASHSIDLKTSIEEELNESHFSIFSIEKGRILILFVGFIFIAKLFFDNSLFDINKMNFLFFTLSLLLSQNPMEFSSRFKKAFVESSGIALQFPFYAGLMGLMEGSGLIKISSDFIISFSDSSSLPVFSFLSAGLVNIFVPSGGGQWVVQGPILLEASKILEVNPAKMAMAIAWGDAWTNLIQPFWAIPILSLAGLKLKDILGYCLVYFMASGIIILGFFCWF